MAIPSKKRVIVVGGGLAGLACTIRLAEAGVPGVPKGSSGITLNSYTLRPKSRGTVSLRSADPRALPVVDPNFLADPDVGDGQVCAPACYGPEMASFSGVPAKHITVTKIDPERLDLSSRRVAVVGGTGGLGRALARLMAARGAEVTVAGRTFRDAGVARDACRRRAAGPTKSKAAPTFPWSASTISKTSPWSD